MSDEDEEARVAAMWLLLRAGALLVLVALLGIVVWRW